MRLFKPRISLNQDMFFCVGAGTGRNRFCRRLI